MNEGCVTPGDGTVGCSNYYSVTFLFCARSAEFGASALNRYMPECKERGLSFVFVFLLVGQGC